LAFALNRVAPPLGEASTFAPPLGEETASTKTARTKTARTRTARF